MGENEFEARPLHATVVTPFPSHRYFLSRVISLYSTRLRDTVSRLAWIKNDLHSERALRPGNRAINSRHERPRILCNNELRRGDGINLKHWYARE